MRDSDVLSSTETAARIEIGFIEQVGAGLCLRALLPCPDSLTGARKQRSKCPQAG